MAWLNPKKLWNSMTASNDQPPAVNQPYGQPSTRSFMQQFDQQLKRELGEDSTDSYNQAYNQSNNQSNNQSYNKPGNQSNAHSLYDSQIGQGQANQTYNGYQQPYNPSINQQNNQQMGGMSQYPPNQMGYQTSPTNQTMNQAPYAQPNGMYPPTNQPINPSMNQPYGQPNQYPSPNAAAPYQPAAQHSPYQYDQNQSNQTNNPSIAQPMYSTYQAPPQPLNNQYIGPSFTSSAYQSTNQPGSGFVPPPPPSNYWVQRAEAEKQSNTQTINPSSTHVDYSDLDPKSMDFAYANRYTRQQQQQ